MYLFALHRCTCHLLAWQHKSTCLDCCCMKLHLSTGVATGAGAPGVQQEGAGKAVQLPGARPGSGCALSTSGPASAIDRPQLPTLAGSSSSVRITMMQKCTPASPSSGLMSGWPPAAVGHSSSVRRCVLAAAGTSCLDRGPYGALRGCSLRWRQQSDIQILRLGSKPSCSSGHACHIVHCACFAAALQAGVWVVAMPPRVIQCA